MQIALALVTLACVSVPGAAPTPAATGLYAVIVRTGPTWDSAKLTASQLHFKEHSANLQRLIAEGTLALGARFGDMGLLVVRAGSEAQARAQFDADPSFAAGTFRLEVHAWRTVASGCLEAPPAATPATAATPAPPR